MPVPVPLDPDASRLYYLALGISVELRRPTSSQAAVAPIFDLGLWDGNGPIMLTAANGQAISITPDGATLIIGACWPPSDMPEALARDWIAHSPSAQRLAIRVPATIGEVDIADRLRPILTEYGMLYEPYLEEKQALEQRLARARQDLKDVVRHALQEESIEPPEKGRLAFRVAGTPDASKGFYGRINIGTDSVDLDFRSVPFEVATAFVKHLQARGVVPKTAFIPGPPATERSPAARPDSARRTP